MPSPHPLVIVGAGGFGREVAALVEAQNAATSSWEIRGFVDDDASLHHQSVMGYPVLGNVRWLSEKKNRSYVIAIGDGETRHNIAQLLGEASLSTATLTHPSVSIHRSTDLGAGSILCKGAAPTVNLQIGSHVVIDQACTLGHDSTLESFVTLHPGANISGNVHLETGVTVGAGAVVLPNVRIGPHTTVGAGAVVAEDLPPHCTAVGVPARPVS